MSLIEHIVPDVNVLQSLIDDLEGALLVIAHADGHLDPKWIDERQREIAEEYGGVADAIPVLKPTEGLSARGFFFIGEAYDGFMGLASVVYGYECEATRSQSKGCDAICGSCEFGHYDPEVVREEAENIVNEYILIPPPEDPIWQEEEVA
ncbi:hypothetical protein HOC80_05450 [archaeon]|jgi:hypothetical protein|nr:hypothetical protein [archaeon]MBT4417518.1 hypothetical protein [archaeon]